MSIVKIGDTVASVERWGLSNPNENIFTIEDTGREAGHCTSETCQHQSHDPRGPIYRLSLKTGEAMKLALQTSESARDDRNPDNELSFYSLPDGRYLVIEEPFHFESNAFIAESLPEPQDEDADDDEEEIIGESIIEPAADSEPKTLLPHRERRVPAPRPPRPSRN